MLIRRLKIHPECSFFPVPLVSIFTRLIRYSGCSRNKVMSTLVSQHKHGKQVHLAPRKCVLIYLSEVNVRHEVTSKKRTPKHSYRSTLFCEVLCKILWHTEYRMHWNVFQALKISFQLNSLLLPRL